MSPLPDPDNKQSRSSKKDPDGLRRRSSERLAVLLVVHVLLLLLLFSLRLSHKMGSEVVQVLKRKRKRRTQFW